MAIPRSIVEMTIGRRLCIIWAQPSAVPQALKPQDCEVSELKWFAFDELPDETELSPADRPSYGKLKAHLGIA